MSGRNPWPPPQYVRLDAVEEAVRAAFEDYSQWVAEYGDTFVAAVMDRLGSQHDSDKSAKSDGDGPPKQDPSNVRQRLRDAGADAWDDQPMVRASELMNILGGLPADATWADAVRDWERRRDTKVIREHDAGDEHRGPA